MKKSLYALLALLVAITMLVGCGPTAEPEPAATQPPAAQEPAAEEPAATEPAMPVEPKIFRDGGLLDQDLSSLDPQR